MSQKNYMCILRSAAGGCSIDEQPSPSDMEQMFAKYQAWQDKFADNILDMGGQLGDSASVVSQDGVTDGPFMELKEIVGGYMLLKADSLEEANGVITASPMVENPGVSIEIREIHTP
jgi:hypothetical protein